MKLFLIILLGCAICFLSKRVIGTRSIPKKEILKLRFWDLVVYIFYLHMLSFLQGSVILSKCWHLNFQR